MPAKIYFKCHGFVLCVVLIFLQLVSMLSLYQLMRASYAIKLSNKQLHHSLFLWQARSTLMQFAKENITCETHPLSDLSLQVHSVDWWRIHACYFKSNHIEYFILQEQLGDDICAKVSPKQSASYRREDLLAIQNTEKVILQATIVKASAVPLSCATEPHVVHIGLQMLRELRT